MILTQIFDFFDNESIPIIYELTNHINNWFSIKKHSLTHENDALKYSKSIRMNLCLDIAYANIDRLSM